MGAVDASHYADRALQATVSVVENERLARDTYRVRFGCPEMARRFLPGQFLMLRLAGCDDPLIGRPLALYDTIPDAEGDPAAIDVVYLVKGKLTSRLEQYRGGQRLEIWGPLGNGFEIVPTDHLIMIAGGIGQTPFLALSQEYLGRRRYGDRPGPAESPPRVTLLYGARSADLLAGVDDFKRCGVEVRVATEDGSRGRHGLVTDLFTDLLAEKSGSRRVVCCGPEGMMEAVARIAAAREIECQVSLETPMACGIGICFSCVAKVRDGTGEWDYKRTCVDGPVFDASQIVWE